MGEFFTAAVQFLGSRNADGTVKMTDLQYFVFFTIAHVCRGGDPFVVFAMFYKGHTYLQSQIDPRRTGDRATARQRRADLSA